MKKSKVKVSFILGCIFISTLIIFSSISIGIVTYSAITVDNGSGEVTNNSSDGIYDNTNNQNNNFVNPESGYFVTDNDVINPGNSGTGNGTVNNNGNSGQQTQGNGNGVVTPTTNELLDTNKTKADIVNIYALVMNKAKADKPGFTKIEYQELPGGEEYRVIGEGSEKVTPEDMDKLLSFVEGLDVFVPKEEALANPYVHSKGDADMSLFPVFSRAKGSYLTDPNGIESYTYKVLPDGNVEMTFVLVSEDNPEPIGENSTVAPSYTGAVFSPMSKAQIDGTVYHPIVTVFARDIKYSLRYHDCSVELTFNPDTLQVVSLNQYANVSIKGSGNVVGIGLVGVERQELLSTVMIKDFVY